MIAGTEANTGTNSGIWRRSIVLLVSLVLATMFAWGWTWHAFSGHPTLLGLALLAWVFGLRHAVDADHIAAIDNVVRRLIQAGQRPLAVGLFFSLGHSSIVITASLVLAAGTAALQDRLGAMQAIGGVVGTSVSAAFLLLIALLNLAILRDVWRDFRQVTQGHRPACDDAPAATSFGPLTRLLQPLFRCLTRSWHMFWLGALFGLGFDTATEIGLLGISAGQGAHGMSPWQILIFPVLFTLGMALIDTADSVVMVGAYGWALARPVRKIWYNLTVTATSVLVALLIGGLETLGLLVEQYGLRGRLWSAVTRLNDDLATFGTVVIGIFLCSWGFSAALYHWKGYDRLAAASAGK